MIQAPPAHLVAAIEGSGPECGDLTRIRSRAVPRPPAGQRYLEQGTVGVSVGGSAPGGVASASLAHGEISIAGVAPYQLATCGAQSFWHPDSETLGL